MRTSLRFLVPLLALALFAMARPAAANEPEPPATDAAHATDAHAADHGPKAGVLPKIHEGIVPMIVSIVVFSAVLAVLSVKVWPMIVKGLSDRENKIREEIESAELARQQAKDALEQYQKSLADARAEAQKLLESARAQQIALSAELKIKADAELSAMRERATRDIESAKRAAIAELYTTSSNLATMIAGKILRRQITPADNQQLIEESISQLQASRN